MKSIFNYSFAFWIFIFLLFCCFILFCIPDIYLEKYQTSTYMESGQIGDIVGGTTNPIIAVLAALLTFLAFWMQYKANKQQRDDISLERFESRLYEMLHLHRENLFDLKCGKDEGRLAVSNFCYKLKFIYILVDKFISYFSIDDKKLFTDYCKKNKYGEIEGKTIIAYNLFLYGTNFSFMYNNLSKERRLYDKLAASINDFEAFAVRIKGDEVYDEYCLKPLEFNISAFIRKTTGDTYAHPGNIIFTPDSLLCGYNDKLGVYFRQLFQIVKYIVLKENINEYDRYQYMRIVRSQLSDFEQILLYYNGLTEIGKAWNETLFSSDLLFSNYFSCRIKSCMFNYRNHWKSSLTYTQRMKTKLYGSSFLAVLYNYYLRMKKEWLNPTLVVKTEFKKDYWLLNMGLISRFRLIKNIPVSFQMFGYVPEIKYFSDIVIYFNHNENFFETKNAYLSYKENA